MVQDTKSISPEDRELWAAEAQSVAPLAQEHAHSPAPRPAPCARMRARDERQVLEESLVGPIDADLLETGDETSFRRPGVRPTLMRKLRRGQFSIQASLDLHGHTRPEAQRAIAEFLSDALAQDLRCVKIIHGKGLRSPRGLPILKARVEISLQQRDEVLAYSSAPNWAGGHGAVLVLLRGRRQQHDRSRG